MPRGGRVYHSPIGDPCEGCGLPASHHRKPDRRIRNRIDNRNRSEHYFVGVEYADVCEKCGLAREQHRAPRGHRSRKKTDAEAVRYIGIDGEGQGRFPHRYVMLAASLEDGSESWIAESHSLSTVECFELILSLPTRRTKIFSYSFNYDITMMIKDLPNNLIYALFRPDLKHRQGKFGPKPVEWEGYKLNLQGTKFTVANDRKRVVIWDLFKFFQAKFVGALKDWKVGTEELWDRMTRMKDKRSELDKESTSAIRSYCLEECRCMALLARKLIDTHTDVGLQLRSYYGAGSSGAAMLTLMGIKERIVPTPEYMKEAVSQAFFGGRFENSVIGAIRESLHNYDISSAYPYQIAFLPCLQHGKWWRSKNRKDIEGTKTVALVRYGLGSNSTIETWGPFPFRTRDGTISFPIESGGGWVWLDEYLSAEKIFPHVQFREAWVYTTRCDCRPFAQIPEFYNLRQKIGKEAKGIVIKLGTNSCYGKLAQSLGKPIFQSWIWAGMITSGCRSQLLEMLALHKNWANILMMATDGIYTREKINPPVPMPTGTGELGKPLGGWEHKHAKKGLFVARPGIYFPLEPTQDEIKEIRARGVGRSVVLESWDKIIRAWEVDGVNAVARVSTIDRFCGGKTSISISEKGEVFKRAANKNRLKPSYGEWMKRPVEMTFDPKPKRERIRPDGVTLELRKFPRDLESVPYKRATMMNSPEAMILRAAVAEIDEQPDKDYMEMDVDDER